MFGRKKLIDTLNKIIQNQDDLNSEYTKLEVQFAILNKKLSDIQKSMSENMVKIPVLQARVRNVEKIYEDEQREEKERISAINMFKN